MDGMGPVPLKKMQATLNSARQAALAAVQRMSQQDAGLSMYLEEVRRVHGEKMYKRAVRKMEREAAEREREKQAQIAHLEAHRRAAFAGLSLAEGAQPLQSDTGSAMGSSAMASEAGGANGTRNGGSGSLGMQPLQMHGEGGAEAGAGSGRGARGGGAGIHVARFGGDSDAEKEAWREKCSKQWAPTDYLLLHGLPGRVSTVTRCRSTVTLCPSTVALYGSTATLCGGTVLLCGSVATLCPGNVMLR